MGCERDCEYTLRVWKKPTMRTLFLTLLYTFWLSTSLLARPQSPAENIEEIVVVAEGMAAVGEDIAAAEEEAIWDAKRNAVEQAVGVFLKSVAVGRDFQITHEEIKSRSQGFLRRSEALPETRIIERVGNSRILRIKVRATVALLPLLKRLEDIDEVFADLERPRLFVEGEKGESDLVMPLKEYLKGQGFVLAENSTSAALCLRLKSATDSLLRLGDTSAPFGLGEAMATQRATLTLQVASIAADETLLVVQAQATGSSFESDSGARASALQNTMESLIEQKGKQITQSLLLRWVRERQEGIVVALHLPSLSKSAWEALRNSIESMRGFREFITETSPITRSLLRFRTRLSVRDVRRRLGDFRHTNHALHLREGRGAIIYCTALRPTLKQSK